MLLKEILFLDLLQGFSLSRSSFAVFQSPCYPSCARALPCLFKIPEQLTQWSTLAEAAVWSCSPQSCDMDSYPGTGIIDCSYQESFLWSIDLEVWTPGFTGPGFPTEVMQQLFSNSDFLLVTVMVCRLPRRTVFLNSKVFKSLGTCGLLHSRAGSCFCSPWPSWCCTLRSSFWWISWYNISNHKTKSSRISDLKS